MAHFYGTVQGNRGEASRLGSKDSGLETLAASWAGAIRVSLFVDPAGRDAYRVTQEPHNGAGVSRLIACGLVGEEPTNGFGPARGAGSPDFLKVGG
jgi:hypothetical protein